MFFTDEALELIVRYADEYADLLVLSKPMSSIRVLVFSHFSDRDGVALLRCAEASLQKCSSRVQHVILTTYDKNRDGRSRIGRYFDPVVTFAYSIQIET